MFSLCSAANIGAILCPILGQYCTTCFTNIGPIFMPNIGPILVINIGQYCRCVALPILGQYCGQYWANTVQRVAPISVKYLWPILPNIGQQYWPILSLCSAANIGAILCPILGQYCTTCCANIGQIFIANIGPILVNNIGQYCHCVALPILGQYCAQYWANIVQRVLTISVQYSWPTLAQYWSTILANIVVV